MGHLSHEMGYPGDRIGIRRLFKRTARTDAAIEAVVTTVDPESGLGNERELMELLRREMARGRRYGDRSTLVAFEVSVTGGEATGDPLPPAAACFVAQSLLTSAREADFVTRPDRTHFAVLLTECDYRGAASFIERARTRIASMPYARDENGTGIYVLAWAGQAEWDISMHGPEEYLAAALADLEESRPGYSRAQHWYGADVAAPGDRGRS